MRLSSDAVLLRSAAAVRLLLNIRSILQKNTIGK